MPHVEVASGGFRVAYLAREPVTEVKGVRLDLVADLTKSREDQRRIEAAREERADASPSRSALHRLRQRSIERARRRSQASPSDASARCVVRHGPLLRRELDHMTGLDLFHVGQRRGGRRCVAQHEARDDGCSVDGGAHSCPDERIHRSREDMAARKLRVIQRSCAVAIARDERPTSDGGSEGELPGELADARHPPTAQVREQRGRVEELIAEIGVTDDDDPIVAVRGARCIARPEPGSVTDACHRPSHDTTAHHARECALRDGAEWEGAAQEPYQLPNPSTVVFADVPAWRTASVGLVATPSVERERPTARVIGVAGERRARARAIARLRRERPERDCDRDEHFTPLHAFLACPAEREREQHHGQYGRRGRRLRS